MAAIARPSASLRVSEVVLVEAVQTPFNLVTVRQVGERIDLEVEGATFATYHPRFVLTGYSWDALACASLLRADGPPRSILVLGLGGGTVTRQLRTLLPEARLVGIEIDAGIVGIARRYMQLDEQDVEVYVEDAYSYLDRATELFDIVIDDLFLTGPTDVVRSRTPSGDTLAALRRRIAPGGLLVANLITDAGMHRTVRLDARRAFVDAFPSVRVVVPPRGLNEILVGGERTLARSALGPYTKRFREAWDRQRFNEVLVKPLRKRS